jgi:hypothetical protein
MMVVCSRKSKWDTNQLGAAQIDHSNVVEAVSVCTSNMG